MPVPMLPMSKSALDRLGMRLMTGDQIDDGDLDSVAQVVDVYQEVLDDVKAQLNTLGYPATTRVKTTATLVEKLRREGRMLLSRVQDLAGARIIVADRPTQDEAAAKIREHFEASGHECKEVDRRRDPSHGYRALHLIVRVGPVRVEIQIRTDLEDTWAQIVERLADQWGRGIRYGEDPADPETLIRAGQQVFSRLQAVAFLIELGDAIGRFELQRGTMMLLGQAGELLGRLAEYADQFPQAQDPRPIAELPEDERAAADIMAVGLTLVAPPESRLIPDRGKTTVAQMFLLLRDSLNSLADENTTMLDQLRGQEQELRDTLQLIASASAYGE